jgi:hypothetical protein
MTNSHLGSPEAQERTDRACQRWQEQAHDLPPDLVRKVFGALK